jgi:hypothetical protein
MMCDKCVHYGAELSDLQHGTPTSLPELRPNFLSNLEVYT